MACWNCRFFAPSEEASAPVDARSRSGQCRVAHPVAIPKGNMVVTEWPTVRGRDWCGEWQPID